MDPLLEELLPHRLPMILVDGIVSYDLEKKKIITSVTISDQSLFYDAVNSGVPAWVGIEYMAQTAGTFSGLYQRHTGKRQIQVGFLLGTRKYESRLDFFRSGETYVIHAENLFATEEAGNFDCGIYDSAERLCAAAKLNVFMPENPQRFFEKE